MYLYCMTHLERHTRLFERIARPYSWFFAGQTRSYAACFEAAGSALPDPRGRRALDIGCGTGAFTAALKSAGWDVSGVDAARAMVSQAGRRGVSCTLADAVGGLPFPDKSFDLVSAAYVAHGLKAPERARLFAEAKRLSKEVVLFHDYSGKRRLLTDIVEYLEGGDYFNFIENGLDELKRAFSSVSVIEVGPQSAWYVCRP